MKTILLVVISILLIAMTWGIMVKTDAQNQLLQKSYVEEILEAAPLANLARQGLAQQLFSEMPQGTPPVMQEQIPIAFFAVFDEPWFTDVIIRASDDLIQTITGEKPSLTTVIDIREEKKLLHQQLMVQLSNLSDQELAQGGLPRMALNMVSMAPPEQVLGGIPDEFSIEQLLSEAGLPMSIAEMQNEYQRAQRNYRTGLIIMIPLLAVVFLLLAGVVGALRWAGWSLVISGAVYLAGLVILRGMLPGIAAEAGLPPAIDPAQLVPVLRLTLNKFMFLPMVAAGVGVLMVAVSIFIPRRRNVE